MSLWIINGIFWCDVVFFFLFFLASGCYAFHKISDDNLESVWAASSSYNIPGCIAYVLYLYSLSKNLFMFFTYVQIVWILVLAKKMVCWGWVGVKGFFVLWSFLNNSWGSQLFTGFECIFKLNNVSEGYVEFACSCWCCCLPHFLLLMQHFCGCDPLCFYLMTC